MPRKIDPLTRRWCKTKADEIAARHGCVMDIERANFAVNWIETYCYLYENVPTPIQVKLIPFAKDIIMRIFGWKRYSKERKMEVRRFRKASVYIPKKNTKALSLDTPIATSGGWKTVESLSVGDEIFGIFGKTVSVTALHPIIEEPCFRVHFGNGEFIDCNSEHLWGVRSLQSSARYNHSALETREIANTLYRKDGARIHSVVMPAPIDLPEKTFELMHPYLLGYWLGNGDKDRLVLTTGKQDTDFIEGRLASIGVASKRTEIRKGSIRLRFGIGATLLKQMSLYKNKHIPEEYLRGSKAQRIELLRGLMDSDGMCSSNGKECSFSTMLDALKDGIGELLSTLGIKFKAYKKPCEIKSIGFKSEYWHIQFSAHSDGIVPFSMPRKANRLNKSFKQISSRAKTCQIVNVEILPSKKMRCISVSCESGMFLCGKTMLPTHNSPLLAFCGLYVTFGEAGHGKKGFTAALDGKQAMISHMHAIQTVKNSVPLSAECEINKTTGRIAHIPSESTYTVISGDNIEGQEGHVANFIGLDEVHVLNEKLIKVLEYAGIACPEPLELGVSTAGNNPDSYGKRRFEYGRAVNLGLERDDYFFHIDYSIDPELTDKELDENILQIGRKTNPAWGVTIFRDEFLSSYERAKRSTSTLADFKMYRLNLWQNSSSPWLKISSWQECNKPEMFTNRALCNHVRFMPRRKLDAYAGFDLAKIYDMAAFALAIPRKREGSDLPDIQLLVKLWLSEQYAKAHNHLAPFLKWAEEGFLTLTPGDNLDYTIIRRDIKRFCKPFNAIQCAYDPMYAEQTMQDLTEGVFNSETGEQIEEGIGWERFEFKQTTESYAKPTEEFEALVLDKRIIHGNNPCMNWQIGHVEAKADAFGKKRPVKPSGAKGDEQSYKKIDGVISAVMACALALRADTNPYEHGGIFSV